MKIEKVSIGEIKPYKNNAKLHPPEQIEQIKKSIRKFGNNDPIAIDENNMIIEGHGRYLALKDLEYKEVEIIRLTHLTEQQKKAYILVHNKLTMDTGFDLDILNLELDNIIDFNMSDFGFEKLNFLDENQKETIEDEIPDIPEEPKAKLGDIYKLGNHRLMCGDSTKRQDIEKLLNGNKPYMVFTDPPYGINVVNNDGKVGAEFGVAKKGKYSKIIADETTETAKKSYNILKTLTNKLIIWGGNYFTNFLEFSDGWLIWDKRCDSGIRNTFADGEMAYCSFHTPIRIYKQLWNGMVREGEKDKRVHPTQKPLRMLGEILKDFSRENELILDVFGGSGSTLIACEQTGRACYMMELDPLYVDVIIERFEKFTGKKAVKINE